MVCGPRSSVTGRLVCSCQSDAGVCYPKSCWCILVKVMLVRFIQSDAVCGSKTGEWTTFFKVTLVCFSQSDAGVF